MKELCPFYSSTAFCPDFNSARAAFNDLHIAPCRNLQIEWFLSCWKEDFMDFPHIRKYYVFASRGRAPCWWHLQPSVFFSSPMLTIFNLLDLGLCGNCLSPPLLILKLQFLTWSKLLYEAPLLSSLYYPKVNDDFKSSFYIHGSPLASSILIHLASVFSIFSQTTLTHKFFRC